MGAIKMAKSFCRSLYGSVLAQTITSALLLFLVLKMVRSSFFRMKCSISPVLLLYH